MFQSYHPRPGNRSRYTPTNQQQKEEEEKSIQAHSRIRNATLYYLRDRVYIIA